MRLVLRGVLGFLAGLVLAYPALIAFYAAFGEAVFGFDRDGGKAMGFIFVLAPAASIVFAIVAGLWWALRRSPRA